MSARRTGLREREREAKSKKQPSKDILEYHRRKGVFGDVVSASSSSSYFGSIVDDKAPYLDLASVAPSPSRDYYRIFVTKSEVKMTIWRISHNPRAIPIEFKIPMIDFEKDIRIPSEVNRVFGKETVDYIVRLSRGQVDKIMHLPNHLLARILFYVGIEHLKCVAPVCSKFAQIAKSDELWKKFYFQYGGSEAGLVETKHQADYLSWKSLFFINRLHFKIGNATAERWVPGLFSERNINIPANNNNIPNQHQNERRPLNSSLSASPSSTSSTVLSHVRSTKGGEGSRYSGMTATTRTSTVDSGINSPTHRINNTRESVSGTTRASFLRGRTGRIVDGNLVPRASVTKLSEYGRAPSQAGLKSGQSAVQNEGHGQKGLYSPRQQATRYTVVQDNNRDRPSHSTNSNTSNLGKNPTRKFTL